MMRRTANVENKELREEITRRGLFMWQVAKRCGVSEPTLIRWMRDKLEPDDERYKLIRSVLDETEGGGHGKKTEVVGARF